MAVRARCFLWGRAVITVIVNRPRCDDYCYASYWKRGLLWTVGQALHSRMAPAGSSNLGSSHRSPPPSALSRGGPQSHPVERNPRLRAVKGLVHGCVAMEYQGWDLTPPTLDPGGSPSTSAFALSEVSRCCRTRLQRGQGSQVPLIFCGLKWSPTQVQTPGLRGTRGCLGLLHHGKRQEALYVGEGFPGPVLWCSA